jgi:predicted DNA-binding transcriptional regulator YafY/transposase-like protein
MPLTASKNYLILVQRVVMPGLVIKEFKKDFKDEDACLEWLKNRLYPLGIECPVCGRITKHHKVSKRRCYACDNCGNQVYPTSGTIFNKTSTPLKKWYKAINRIYRADGAVSARDLEKEFGLTYKTAVRMLKKIREFLSENGLAGPRIEAQDIPEYPDSDSVVANDTSQAESPVEIYRKRDRTARLLNIQMLLCQHPGGLKIDEIASRCSISKRTAYRDLRALESELGVPVWEAGSKRGITEGFFLPPVSLTTAEATIVFLAARLIQNYSHLNNPGLTSTFLKLNSIVPMPLKKEIENTLEYLDKQPKDIRQINNFNKLIRAWLSQHKVKILCQYIDEEEPVERVIDPYFIEPSIIGGSSYVIAYCHLRKKICAFKLERITGEVILEPETYKIPADFNTLHYLGAAWGIQTDGEIQTIKLHFSARLSRVIAEFNVHPTQVNQLQKDGSLIMTLKVRDNIHFRNWIMGWADEVEVIEPESMKDQIRQVAKALVNKYPDVEC